MIATLGRLLFLFVGLILVAITLLFLAWTGVLGASAELKLKLLVDWALDFYDLNKEAIHRAIPWIGAVGSAIWAAVVFARAWHYADQTLPQRLEEFNKRTAKAVLSKRDDVLSFVTAGQQGTPASSNSWSFSSWLQHRSLRSYCTNLDSLSAELDTQLSMLSGTKLHRSIERATVHLAQGLRIVRQADEEKTALLGDPLRKNARIQFRQAAELDPNAIWALQYAVDQSKKLGQDDEAAIDLDRLCKSKIEDRQRARALFLLAEILHRRGAGADCKEWVAARRNLDDAVDLLQPLSTQSAVKIELANALRLLGRVQTSRERFTAARGALNRAKSLFAGLDATAVRSIDDQINSITGEKDASASD